MSLEKKKKNPHEMVGRSEEEKHSHMAMLGKDRQAAVILNTVYPQYRDNFVTWGAGAYVINSSDFTELRTKIREVLNRRKKTEQTEVFP